jgi:Lon protease-like protein
VAISEGAEVGPAETFPVGTLAAVVDWRQETDGVLGITIVGGNRFEIMERSIQKDGLYVGRIEELEPEAYVTLPPEHEDLAQLLRQVLPKLGSVYPYVAEAYDDATWVGYRLAEMLPLSLQDKQACLAMSDPVARLDKLRATFN